MKKVIFFIFLLLVAIPFCVADEGIYPINLYKDGNSTMITISYGTQSKSIDFEYDDEVNSTFNLTLESVQTIDDLITYLDVNFTNSLDGIIDNDFMDQQAWFQGTFTNVTETVNSLKENILECNISYTSMASRRELCDYKLVLLENTTIPELRSNKEEDKMMFTLLVFLVIVLIIVIAILLIMRWGLFEKFATKTREKVIETLPGNGGKGFKK